MIKDRDAADAFEVAADLASQYYTTPPKDRELFIRSIINAAHHSLRVRRALTIPTLVKPDMTQKSLFHRRAPETYRTIAQIADSYCRRIIKMRIYEAVKHSELPWPQSGDEDMTNFDLPFGFKDSQPKAMSAEEFDSKLNRSEYSYKSKWLTDYAKAVLTASTVAPEALPDLEPASTPTLPDLEALSDAEFMTAFMQSGNVTEFKPRTDEASINQTDDEYNELFGYKCPLEARRLRQAA